MTAAGYCRKRRGAVLPLVAVLMAGVVLCAGLVIDMSRAYAQKNELQTAVDAATLAAVMELLEDTTGVLSAAENYGALNLVMRRSLPGGNLELSCGVWDDDTRTFAPSDHCGISDNAVSVTLHDTATFTFPLLFGQSQKPILATARGWAAYVGGARCVKPWGMNWQLLTRVLDPGWPQVQQCQQSGGSNCDQFLQKNPARPQLDEEDVENLRSRPPESLRFSLTEAQPPSASGNFGALRLPNSTGTNDYRNNISGCNPGLMIPGATINTEPGLMGNATHMGVEALCQAEGSLGPSSVTDPGPPPVRTRRCFSVDGEVGLPVIAVLWEAPPLVGSTTVTIKQLVSFKIETVSNNNVIVGHFAPGNVTGTVTNQLTTIRRPVLVD